MTHGSNRLSAKDCRDTAKLREFLQSKVSVNSWPVLSRPLLRVCGERGIDLVEARRFTISIDGLEGIVRWQASALERVERMLGLDNAFHHKLHNFDVLLRLFALEWPETEALPGWIRRSCERTYPSIEEILPVLLRIARALENAGVPSGRIARDTLAALGHDYGHTGGTDRTDRMGRPTLLSHEDVAERHTAKVGLRFGLPPALVLECLAGIRATTFYSRKGRPRIAPANEFERRLALADLMGCALPAEDWLSHVAVPVLKEKIPFWKRRLPEIAAEMVRLESEMAALPREHPGRTELESHLAELEDEETSIPQDFAQFLRYELRFLAYLEAHKLASVGRARELWGEAVRSKVDLLDRLLRREDLLRPLAQRGFPFLETFADSLANTPSLERWISAHPEFPRLNEVLSAFLAAEPPVSSGPT